MYKGILPAPPGIVRRFIISSGEGAYDLVFIDMVITVLFLIAFALIFFIIYSRINNKGDSHKE
jgi:hypothetical protein